MYGKKIKNYAYMKNKSKAIFNSKFGSILCKLELRLNVLMVRVGFVNKLQKVNSFISSGKVSVNFIIKDKNYYVRVGDLISFIIPSLKTVLFKRFKKFRWRRFKWNK
jgi:ribosomal protein S4